MTFILSNNAKQCIKNNTNLIEILCNMSEEETFEMFEIFTEFYKLTFEELDKYILTNLDGKISQDKYFDDGSLANRDYEIFITSRNTEERGRMYGYFFSIRLKPNKYERFCLLRSLRVWTKHDYKEIIYCIKNNETIRYEDVLLRKRAKNNT